MISLMTVYENNLHFTNTYMFTVCIPTGQFKRKRFPESYLQAPLCNLSVNLELTHSCPVCNKKAIFNFKVAFR